MKKQITILYFSTATRWVILFFSAGIYLCTGAASPCHGQSALTDSAVYEPIKMLFAGMHRGDSGMVRQAFTPNAMMATVGKDKEGRTTLKYNELRDFLIAVGTPHPEPWSEHVWDIKIESDGGLANVWAKYAFYVGAKFSHCGVDAFQLFRNDAGKWKIIFVADTRQNDGCEVPPVIRKAIK